jgi:hypothetical protein
VPKWLKTTTMAAWSQSLAAPLLLLAILTGFHWRIALTNQFTWLESPDLARQVLPWLQMQAGELRLPRLSLWERLPLWDPYAFGGQPLLAQAQPGAAYPLNWLLYLLPTRQGWIQEQWLNAFYLATRFLAAFFAFLLARAWGCRRPAAMLGGLVFALGGYVGDIDWPQMVNGAVWGPLILLFLTRALEHQRRWGSAAVGGVCLGMAFLAGHHQVPIYLSLMAAGVWLYGCWRERFSRSLLGAAVLFFTCAALVSALQSWPAWEYSHHAVRWVGLETPVSHTDRVPQWIHHQYSLRPSSLFSIVFPGAPEHVSPFIGAVALLLAVTGVRAYWFRVSTRLALGCAVGGFLFALGGETPFQGILYAVLPVVDKARNPAMALAVYSVGMAVLVGLGVQAILERPVAFLERWTATLTLALTALLLLNATVRHSWEFDPRGVPTALALLLATLALRSLRLEHLSARAALALLAAAVIFELSHGSVTRQPHDLDPNRNRDLPNLRHDAELVNTIRKIDPLARWDIADTVARHNVGDWNGVDVYGGYLASLTARFWELEPHNSTTRRLWSVPYRIDREPLQEWNEEIHTSASGWKVYRNRNVLPRLRSVHHAEVVRELNDVKYILAKADWDYDHRVFLYHEAPELEQCAEADFLTLLRRQSQRVAFYAEMGCRGMVILSDTAYPGWEVRVNGEPARLWYAYGAQRGVVLDRGRHLVEMRFRPQSVYLGFLLTVSGLLAALVIWRVDRPSKL